MDFLPSSPFAEIPSDRAARRHGGLAFPIPLNGAGTSEEKGMRDQDSQQSSHHFCCLGETTCQAGKRPFNGFLCRATWVLNCRASKMAFQRLAHLDRSLTWHQQLLAQARTVHRKPSHANLASGRPECSEREAEEQQDVPAVQSQLQITLVGRESFPTKILFRGEQHIHHLLKISLF